MKTFKSRILKVETSFFIACTTKRLVFLFDINQFIMVETTIIIIWIMTDIYMH